jgi:carboxypeptidase Taq
VEGAWSALKQRLEELDNLGSAMGLLEWDQQTHMPSGGAVHRGAQLATLSAIHHERLTDPRLTEWMEAIDSAGSDPIQKAAIRNTRRQHTRATQVPVDLVRAFARARADGFTAWGTARESGSFADFVPALRELVALTRQVVQCYGPAEHSYDHLLESYDPGSRTAELQPMFGRLRSELSEFVAACGEVSGPEPLNLQISMAEQMRLNERVVKALGFRGSDGRLDRSIHPFTVGLGPHDVRLTTRVHELDPLSTLGGTIHECGHGMYEQGLPMDLAGTGLCSAAGMGLHESQSRFWENIIGHSRAFCSWLCDEMKSAWPGLDISTERIYGASNRVMPSFVRVEADEATYNLHIVVRFQLELALIEGSLEVEDLEQAWSDAYEEVLHIRPTTPVQGVLQDVHWASGLFGYFPSYTIGNLYSASFRFQMEEDLPDMWDQVAAGEFGAVLDWLRSHIHQKGHTLDAPQIFEEAVGDRDPVADLMAHLKSRSGSLYGVA